jgi:hypothetical protein
VHSHTLVRVMKGAPLRLSLVEDVFFLWSHTKLASNFVIQSISNGIECRAFKLYIVLNFQTKRMKHFLSRYNSTKILNYLDCVDVNVALKYFGNMSRLGDCPKTSSPWIL